jgi:hypothetical protein
LTIASALTVPFRPKVLLIGQDAGSLQIAASLMRRVAGDRIAVDTADAQPVDMGGRTDEMLVAMGLNPVHEQRLSVRALHRADWVVGLGVALDVARLPGPRYEEWDLAHDDLLERVQALSDRLTTVPAAEPPSALPNRLRALLGAIRRH